MPLPDKFPDRTEFFIALDDDNNERPFLMMPESDAPDADYRVLGPDGNRIPGVLNWHARRVAEVGWRKKVAELAARRCSRPDDGLS